MKTGLPLMTTTTFSPMVSHSFIHLFLFVVAGPSICCLTWNRSVWQKSLGTAALVDMADVLLMPWINSISIRYRYTDIDMINNLVPCFSSPDKMKSDILCFCFCRTWRAKCLRQKTTASCSSLASMFVKWPSPGCYFNKNRVVQTITLILWPKRHKSPVMHLSCCEGNNVKDPKPLPLCT